MITNLTVSRETRKPNLSPVHVCVGAVRVRSCISIDAALSTKLDDRWPSNTTLVRDGETVAVLEKIGGRWGWLLRVKEVA